MISIPYNSLRIHKKVCNKQDLLQYVQKQFVYLSYVFEFYTQYIRVHVLYTEIYMNVLTRQLDVIFTKRLLNDSHSVGI